MGCAGMTEQLHRKLQAQSIGEQGCPRGSAAGLTHQLLAISATDPRIRAYLQGKHPEGFDLCQL